MSLVALVAVDVGAYAAIIDMGMVCSSVMYMTLSDIGCMSCIVFFHFLFGNLFFEQTSSQGIKVQRGKHADTSEEVKTAAHLE